MADTPQITAGVYAFGGRRFAARLDEAGAVRIRVLTRSGKPASTVAVVTAGELRVTGNGRAYVAQLAAIAAAPAAHRVEARCARCWRVLTDPASIAAGVGRECAEGEGRAA